MMRLPKQMKIKCPNCNTAESVVNLRPTMREHKIMLSCNKCRTEMHITDTQIEEWRAKAQEFLPKQKKKK